MRFIIFLPLGLVLLTIGALPWVEQNNLEKVWAGKPLPAFFYTLPFMDKPQAALAYRWLQGEYLDDRLVEQQIERALVARPLHPDNWLLAARVKQKLGKSSEAQALAEHAYSLGPTRAYLLWNLAMFWLTIPDQNKTIALLHDYLLAKPHDVERVLLLAYRFNDNKAALLETLIPKQPAAGYDYDEDFYAARILRTGLKLKNAEMASLAWNKFKNRSLSNNPNAGVIKAYLNFLIAQNDKSGSFAVWHAVHPDRPLELGVMNAGFEHKLLGYGFGWRTDQKQGVDFERSFDQAVEGDYSLKISLDGTENTNLYRPGITLPVDGGLRYQLSVYWKGEQITTRSNPFFEIVYKQGDKTQTVRSEPRRGSWNWQRVDMAFEVPEGVNFIEFRLRRWQTNALDKLISGTVYIDDVRLTALPPDSKLSL